MTEWKPIETAPKDGSEFLATNGVLLGVGYHHRHVEPPTVRCWRRWRAYYDQIRAPFRVQFTANGLFPEGFDYLDNSRRENEALEAAKGSAPKIDEVPNPKAGQVEEWDHASAFYAFDGESETVDYDGPVGFKPTHWVPIPSPLHHP